MDKEPVTSIELQENIPEAVADARAQTAQIVTDNTTTSTQRAQPKKKAVRKKPATKKTTTKKATSTKKPVVKKKTSTAKPSRSSTTKVAQKKKPVTKKVSTKTTSSASSVARKKPSTTKKSSTTKTSTKKTSSKKSTSKVKKTAPRKKRAKKQDAYMQMQQQMLEQQQQFMMQMQQMLGGQPATPVQQEVEEQHEPVQEQEATMPSEQTPQEIIPATPDQAEATASDEQQEQGDEPPKDKVIEKLRNIIEAKKEQIKPLEIQPKIKADISKKNFQSKSSEKGDVSQEEAEQYSAKLKELTREINKVFIGQDDVVEKVLISLMCDAHTLLEGVPGLAKTLLIETLAKTLSGTSFKRIQFLPDLLPADIIGGQVFNPKTAEFKTFKGPIFANFVLCDEINRAPPKTHAAVMEAMQEKKINIENEEFILDRPFFVLATQNPLENKGTYELPEAVLDRFMFKVILDYPKRKDELIILTENGTTKNIKEAVKPIMSKQELLDIQKKVKTVYVSSRIKEFVMDLVEATRGINKHIEGVKFVKYGAGVRAGIYLIVSAKAKAIYEGRNYVLPDDVISIAPNVLRHRIALNFRGKAHGISAEKIMEEIFTKVNII